MKVEPLANDEHRETFVLDPHGSPADPCTDPELLDKFSRLASFVKPSETVKNIAQTVQRLERLSSVRELTERLQS